MGVGCNIKNCVRGLEKRSRLNYAMHLLTTTVPVHISPPNFSVCSRFLVESNTLKERWRVCVWLVECRRMHIDMYRAGVGGGGGEYERSRQEKGAGVRGGGGGVRRQTQFVVLVGLNKILFIHRNHKLNK